MLTSGDLGYFDLSRSQLRFTWFTEPPRCLVRSVKSFQLAVIGALITNIVLLLIVIVGLLRLRLRCTGGVSFGLQRFLWNQVRWFLFFFAEVLSSLCVVSFARVSFGSS